MFEFEIAVEIAVAVEIFVLLIAWKFRIFGMNCLASQRFSYVLFTPEGSQSAKKINAP